MVMFMWHLGRNRNKVTPQEGPHDLEKAHQIGIFTVVSSVFFFSLRVLLRQWDNQHPSDDDRL